MKKKKFDEIKTGECFKYHGIIYRKYDYHDAVSLTGKTCYSKFFRGFNNVIPVIVTIKVKEK